MLMCGCYRTFSNRPVVYISKSKYCGNCSKLVTFSASTEYCKIGKEKSLDEKVLDNIIHYITSKYKQRLVRKKNKTHGKLYH